MLWKRRSSSEGHASEGGDDDDDKCIVAVTWESKGWTFIRFGQNNKYIDY